MPIILEVNDYDSEDDVSSTEDDNNVTNIENKNKNKSNKKNKKNKKVKFNKKPVLKESKIIKDTAKKKIKKMEKQILKSNCNYSDVKIENETNQEIKEFFTDAELAEQFEELRKLEETQKKLWKYSANSHVAIPETVRRGNLYMSNMPLMINNNSMFLNTRKMQNESRTQQLNSNSIVNTNMPLLSGSKIINRGYSNIGKMW